MNQNMFRGFYLPSLHSVSLCADRISKNILKIKWSEINQSSILDIKIENIFLCASMSFLKHANHISKE